MAGELFLKLKEYDEEADFELSVIEEAKCLLANEGELRNFSVDGAYISVLENGGGYDLYGGSLMIELECEGRLITNFRVV